MENLTFFLMQRCLSRFYYDLQYLVTKLYVAFFNLKFSLNFAMIPGSPGWQEASSLQHCTWHRGFLNAYYRLKGGETSNRFRLFKIAKIKHNFWDFFVLILSLRLQQYFKVDWWYRTWELLQLNGHFFEADFVWCLSKRTARLESAEKRAAIYWNSCSFSCSRRRKHFH